ncbi:MAG: formylglycine-generating enzyme family protein [Rubripirellula sp.]
MNTLLFRLPTFVFFLCLSQASLVSLCRAGIVTFGSGANEFDLEFVAIGNVGNTADQTSIPSPIGSVAYAYQMGKYEVSRGMINSYNTLFGTSNSREITMQTLAGSNTSGEAAGGISWNEAARFINWLNMEKGYSAAYKFLTDGVNDNASAWDSSDAGYDGSNPYRNRNAVFVLPTLDEWYKAAYFNPVDGSWRDYASLDGNLPSVTSGGTSPNTAVYNNQPGPAEITQAGGLNAYGIMGMNGNVREWDSSLAGTDNRGLLGGSWSENASFLAASFRNDRYPDNEYMTNGFRIAQLTSSSGSSTSSTPEPTSLAILGGVALITASYRRRKLTSR